MRDLTFEEIDKQLAEQLPSHERMGSCCNPCCKPECTITLKVCIAL